MVKVRYEAIAPSNRKWISANAAQNHIQLLQTGSKIYMAELYPK
jgi:hypothetical protein